MKTALTQILQRAAEGAYGEDSALIGKIAGLILAAKFDKSVGPFICGIFGETGTDGLAKAYSICPCYGADVTATYIRRGAAHGSFGFSQGSMRAEDWM